MVADEDCLYTDLSPKRTAESYKKMAASEFAGKYRIYNMLINQRKFLPEY